MKIFLRELPKSIYMAGFFGLCSFALPSCISSDNQATAEVGSVGLGRQVLSWPFGRYAVKDAELPAGRPTEYLTGFLWSVKPSDLDSNSEEEAVTGYTIAEAVPGRSGLVYSPHVLGMMVNVKNFSAGEQVKCPHSGLLFVVPDNVAPVAIVASADVEKTVPSNTAKNVNLFIEEQEKSLFEAEEQGPAGNGGPRVAKPDGLTAIRVAGRENQVFSPYASRNYIVDVTGLKPGDQARCPYTGRIFVIPNGNDAAKDQKSKAIVDEAIAAISDKLSFRVLSEKEESPMIGAPKVEEPKDTVPFAMRSKRYGYVLSPFGGQLIDVRGKTTGSLLRCPFSGKLFRVPESQD